MKLSPPWKRNFDSTVESMAWREKWEIELGTEGTEANESEDPGEVR